MRQFSLFLVYFLAGAGVAALAFWAFRPFASSTVPVAAVEEGHLQVPAPAAAAPSPATRGPASKAGGTPSVASPPAGRNAPSQGAGRADAPSHAPAFPAAGSGAGAAEAPPSPPGAWPVVRGCVVFEDGAGLPGVPVRALRQGKWHAECLSGEDGSFALAVPGPGAWRVAAFPYGDQGFQPGEDLRLAAGTERFLNLRVPGSLSVDVAGTVTDEEGRPLAGVAVTAVSAPKQGEAVTGEAVTGADGGYAVRGLSVPLDRPAPETPRELRTSGRLRFGRRMMWHAPKLSVRFQHPVFGEKAEHVSLGRCRGGVLALDVTLLRPGWVAGRLSVPDGAELEQRHLRYAVESGRGQSGSSVPLEGLRFRIPILRKGRLVLGPRIGSFRVENPNLGEVDRSTRREGVIVRLVRFRTHEMTLVDEDGLPFERSTFLSAWFETGRLSCDDVDVRSSRILLPLPVEEKKTLVIQGTGVKEKRVEIRPGNLPARIVLQRLAPLMTGFVRFPPGFEAFDEIRLLVESRTATGTSARGGGFTGLDRETGAFTIHRHEERGLETVYTVTVTLPGHAPWKKEGIRLDEGKTLQNVDITFGK